MYIHTSYLLSVTCQAVSPIKNPEAAFRQQRRVGDAHLSGAFRWPPRSIAGWLVDVAMADADERREMAGTPAGERRLKGATRLNGKSQALSSVDRPTSRDSKATYNCTRSSRSRRGRSRRRQGPFEEWRDVAHRTRDVVHGALRRLDALQAARYCDARQPPAVATLPLATKGWFSTSTPASSTQGFVVRSVQAGTASSSPSLASTSVPEHCAPSSCRAGSSCSCAINVFVTTAQVPHALRLALGSLELDSLRDALEKVKRVINDPPY